MDHNNDNELYKHLGMHVSTHVRHEQLNNEISPQTGSFKYDFISSYCYLITHRAIKPWKYPVINLLYIYMYTVCNMSISHMLSPSNFSS